MALSKIQIIGNLGRDPELRYTPNGRPVASFTVAVNQSTKNQQSGEWIESTDWFRVSVWGDRGERAAENLRKGARVFVDGRFRTREYEANDRQKRLSLDITADKTVQIDYKEVNRLRRYLSERAKIEPRRKTGTCAGHQRELSVALKRARLVALLPYAPQHLRP